MEYEVGDWVFLKIRPYHQVSLARKRNEKLSPKYFGPCQIIAKVGVLAYKLALPEEATIHPVFHVSQLKKLVGPHHTVILHTPKFSGLFEWLVEPQLIRGYRQHPVTQVWEVLVQWKGLPIHDATWEVLEDFRCQFSMVPT